MLIWLAFAAGRGCGTDAPPKDRPAPEVKAQRAAEEDVAALRERLAAEDVADAAAWQAQIDHATVVPDGDTDAQLQQLAALARQAKQRNKR